MLTRSAPASFGTLGPGCSVEEVLMKIDRLLARDQYQPPLRIADLTRDRGRNASAMLRNSGCSGSGGPTDINQYVTTQRLSRPHPHDESAEQPQSQNVPVPAFGGTLVSLLWTLLWDSSVGG